MPRDQALWTLSPNSTMKQARGPVVQVSALAPLGVCVRTAQEQPHWHGAVGVFEAPILARARSALECGSSSYRLSCVCVIAA
jgi:hypothetical protein